MTDTLQTNSQWKQCCYKDGWLTQTLGHLSGPRSIPLTGQHSWGGQLVTMETAVADTGSPAVVCSLHLPVIYLRWGITLEHWNETNVFIYSSDDVAKWENKVLQLNRCSQTEPTNPYQIENVMYDGTSLFVNLVQISCSRPGGMVWSHPEFLHLSLIILPLRLYIKPFVCQIVVLQCVAPVKHFPVFPSLISIVLDFFFHLVD